MKNLKNTLAAVGLAAVLGIGTVSANAAVITDDISARETKGQCSVDNNGVFGQFAGIIDALTGINIFDAPCKTDEEVPADGYRKARQEIVMDGFRR